MEIITEQDYETLGSRVADDLLECVAGMEAPLICPTSGSTPASLYKALVRKIRGKNIDVSGWRFVGLDEWMGMNGDDEGSCRDNLNETLFRPLNISKEQICFFDGRAADPQAECKKVESFIKAHGPITVAVVGLGMNGHVGMNEPGVDPHNFSHVADIAEMTQAVGQKYFKEPKEIKQGLTLGIATLMAAQHVFLMVNGESKAHIVAELAEKDLTSELPATLLKAHADFRLYVDIDAGKSLI